MYTYIYVYTLGVPRPSNTLGGDPYKPSRFIVHTLTRLERVNSMVLTVPSLRVGSSVAGDGKRRRSPQDVAGGTGMAQPPIDHRRDKHKICNKFVMYPARIRLHYGYE